VKWRCYNSYSGGRYWECLILLIELTAGPGRRTIAAGDSTKSTGLVCLFVLLASAITLAQTSPVPLIDQPLVPDAAAPGGAGFTLTVNGTGFVSGSVVNWNGAMLATTFVASSQVTATVPATDIAVPGTASVTVTNPAPGGGVSNVMYFDVANQASSLVFSNFYSSLNAGGLTITAIIAADFNGDGELDLAWVDGSPTVQIELGNGDGTFQAPLQYPVGNGPGGVFAADFNGDGKLDLAVANSADNTISILLGNGDGTFQAGKTFATGAYPFSVSAGDFNGDGKLDLAVACNGANDVAGSISILLGNGDGTFQTHTDYTPPTPFPSVDAMAMGDFNGDGKLDVALADDANGGFLFILLGNGDGTFQFMNSFVGNVSYHGMLTADVNGDGILDLLISQCGEPGEIAVLIGNGDGTFQPAVGYSTGQGSCDYVAGDVNADGKLDLAVPIAYSTADSNIVAILLGNGDGTFQSPVTFSSNSPDCIPNEFCFAQAVAMGDFNDDGRADLAVAVQNSPNSLLVLLQGTWPALAAAPPNVGFGSQNVGTSSAPQGVTLINTGSATLGISSISITGANAGDFSQTNNCGATLAPNASCQVNATFSPGLPGAQNAAINITSSSFGHPISVPLTGAGNGALASASPPTVTFPAQYVGTSGLPQTVTVTNAGTAALTITSVTTSVADFAALSNCTNPVGPNANCTIGVFFDPTASGARNGTLIITDNAGGSPQTVTLSGAGEDFSMSPSGQTTATVSPGQTASYTLSIAPGGGFNQTVAMSCSGAPAQSTCSLSSSSVALNGSKAATVTVTVTTAGGSAGLTQPFGRPPYGGMLDWLAFSGTLGLALLLTLPKGLRERRPRIPYGLVFLCLLSMGITMSACGSGSNSSSGGSGGTPAGSYDLAVTGTFTSGSTTLTHTTKLTLVVQ
jgi:hypothetical protein